MSVTTMVPEVNVWRYFISQCVFSMLNIFYVLSQIILTLYALWYVASLGAFIATYGVRRPQGIEIKCETLLKNPPAVAIVYPVYNDYEILESLVKAVKVDYPNYRIVIVDDSDDAVLQRDR